MLSTTSSKKQIPSSRHLTPLVIALLLTTVSLVFGDYNDKTKLAPAKGVELLLNKRILILGDSITQAGSYVSYINYFLNKSYPNETFDVISIGLSSETASGLSEERHAGGRFPRPCVHERLQRALDFIKPQLVFACYGMNDGIYKPFSKERMKAFTDGISKLASKCKTSGAEVVLITPPIFEGPMYDDVLSKFSSWEVNNPPAGVIKVIDLHRAMLSAKAKRVENNPKFRFTSDRIHPSEIGHMVMATSILKALNIKTPKGSAEELLRANRRDPVYKLIDKKRKIRSLGWLNYVGYTRSKKVEPKINDINAIEKQLQSLQSQIEELNRKQLK